MSANQYLVRVRVHSNTDWETELQRFITFSANTIPVRLEYVNTMIVFITHQNLSRDRVQHQMANPADLNLSDGY